MGWLGKKTPEEAAEAAAKEKESAEFWADWHRRHDQSEVDLERRQSEHERELARRAFFASPAGLARTAFERGDHVLQLSIDVMRQLAIIIPLAGSATEQQVSDPSADLNSVCREGWELVTGSFVFVAQQEQSRDKLLSSGQNTAIQGQTVGYYLFKRCERNRRESSNPWDEETPERPPAEELTSPGSP